MHNIMMYMLIMCSTHSHKVSATFAASLVISPALGTYIESYDHGEVQVIILASMITLFNLLFIIFMVPESLQDRKATWGTSISWEQADPFAVSNFSMFLCGQATHTCTCIYVYM